MRLYLSCPDDFDFISAVGSYGFFALAPNLWDPHAGTLTTTLNVGGAAMTARLRAGRQRGRTVVAVSVPDVGRVTGRRRGALVASVRRMLWLDEDLTDFHTLCRADPDLRRATELRFGRLLRSPTLFEDVVKTICTCNITWGGTQSVVRRMVETYGSAVTDDGHARAFPTPSELAATTEHKLNRTCGVGYRAEWIITFARQVADRTFDVRKCEDHELPTDELYRYLRTIRGVGDYAASGLCALLGRYDRIAIDTETVKHFRLRYPRRKPTPANIKKHYARYHPYQYLVYWWELLCRYADDSGLPQGWDTKEATGTSKK